MHFQGIASHTAKNDVIEIMGSGVAHFDHDNDGCLDLFLLNGAPLSDPMVKGAIPQKDGPRSWNRLNHQKADGSFEDVTEKAVLQGIGYDIGTGGSVQAFKAVEANRVIRIDELDTK